MTSIVSELEGSTHWPPMNSCPYSCTTCLLGDCDDFTRTCSRWSLRGAEASLELAPETLGGGPVGLGRLEVEGEPVAVRHEAEVDGVLTRVGVLPLGRVVALVGGGLDGELAVIPVAAAERC